MASGFEVSARGQLIDATEGRGADDLDRPRRSMQLQMAWVEDDWKLFGCRQTGTLRNYT
jgi:hypothetical protein